MLSPTGRRNHLFYRLIYDTPFSTDHYTMVWWREQVWEVIGSMDCPGICSYNVFTLASCPQDLPNKYIGEFIINLHK